MANKLLTFLGTNDYIECNYYLENPSNKIKNCRFVQSALVQLLCNTWNRTDYIIVFATKEAKKVNYDTPNKYKKPGLNTTLTQLNLRSQIKQVSIPEGKNIDELWKIFEIVLNEIQEQDNIIFDITHSFRSLPIVLIIILNYAKVLKNIKLVGIYYGAIESLGPIDKLRNMDIESRNVPIFNLTKFISVLDWAIAIKRFLDTGDANLMSCLAN